MDITISMSPYIVYAALAATVAMTVIVTCYLDARNRVKS